MDARETSYEDNIFDMIIDKGTVDALLSTAELEIGENQKVHEVLREMFRILKPGCFCIVVSRNGICTLTPYLYEDGVEWEVEVKDLVAQKGKLKNVNFIYFLKSNKIQVSVTYTL